MGCAVDHTLKEKGRTGLQQPAANVLSSDAPLLPGANKAVEALNGRWFAKRNISAELYDPSKFAAGDYSG